MQKYYKNILNNFDFFYAYTYLTMSYSRAVEDFLELLGASGEIPILYGREFPREYRIEYHDWTLGLSANEEVIPICNITLTSVEKVTHVCNSGKPEESHHTAPVKIKITIWTESDDCLDKVEKGFANVVINFPNFTTCVYTSPLSRLFEDVLQELKEDL